MPGCRRAGRREEVPTHDWYRVLSGHRGTVATIGMLSNVAELVRVGPPLHASSLVVMGGLFPPTDLTPPRDHNLAVDPEGALLALTAGIPLVFVPIDVTITTGLYPRHVERLRGGDPFCVLLAGLLDAFVPRTGHAMAGGRVAHLHDPLAIACAVDDSFVDIERLPVTVARVGDTVRTFIDPVAGVEADVVRRVEPEALRRALVGRRAARIGLMGDTLGDPLAIELADLRRRTGAKWTRYGPDIAARLGRRDGLPAGTVHQRRGRGAASIAATSGTRPSRPPAACRRPSPSEPRPSGAGASTRPWSTCCRT